MPTPSHAYACAPLVWRHHRAAQLGSGKRPAAAGTITTDRMGPRAAHLGIRLVVHIRLGCQRIVHAHNHLVAAQPAPARPDCICVRTLFVGSVFVCLLFVCWFSVRALFGVRGPEFCTCGNHVAPRTASSSHAARPSRLWLCMCVHRSLQSLGRLCSRLCRSHKRPGLCNVASHRALPQYKQAADL